MSRRKPSPRVLKISEIEKLRDKPRALVSQPAVGWLDSDEKKHWIRIVDISQSGVKVLDLEKLPKVGSRLKIWWQILAGLKEIELDGEVVWSRKGTCGLRLMNLGKKETHILSQFVKFHRSEL